MQGRRNNVHSKMSDRQDVGTTGKKSHHQGVILERHKTGKKYTAGRKNSINQSLGEWTADNDF